VLEKGKLVGEYIIVVGGEVWRVVGGDGTNCCGTASAVFERPTGLILPDMGILDALSK